LFQVLQPQIDILNDEKIENNSKISTKLLQNSSYKPVFETDRCNKDKDSFQNYEDLIPIENLTVIPITQSSESRQNRYDLLAFNEKKISIKLYHEFKYLKKSIYSNKFFHNFHLFESSYT
jgi:hypothetical protein